MTTGQALQFLKNKLTPLLGDLALPQSEQILQFILSCSRSELYLNLSTELDKSLIPQMSAILERSLSGEPLPYITGKAFFYSREFAVTPDVLIPRPDTETLIEAVLANQKQKQCLFADIGTGSGILSCILTEHNTGWKAIAVDISFSALKVARSNCRSGIYFICADLLSSFKAMPVLDFIVSNPPYISADEMKVLDSSVSDFEPHRALYGGRDGLDFYRKLALGSSAFLKSEGRIYCEIGYNQELQVREIFKDSGWSDISVIKDLSGNFRVIMATRPQKI